MTAEHPAPVRVSSDHLRRILDGLPTGVAIIDGTSQVLWVNETVTSFAPSVTVGESLRESLVELAHEQKMDRLLVRHEVITMPGQPGGPDFHWMVWEEPLEAGEWVLMVWEADWSEEMTERRTAFTMAASHELRTPLTALLGFAELLEMDNDNLRPEQLEAVRVIAETAGHLTTLVEDIFELTANSFGELRLQLEQVDIPQLARSTVEAVTPEVESLGCILTLEIEPDLPVIEADPARVRQMMGNLIRNAARHNPSGTRIDVEIWSTDTEIGILVADNGDGLPFENPQDSFSSFRRGGMTTGDRAGAGIGLTITKRLIELHRGSIDVRSEQGAGTAFTLWFPIDRSSALTPGRPGPA